MNREDLPWLKVDFLTQETEVKPGIVIAKPAQANYYTERLGLGILRFAKVIGVEGEFRDEEYMFHPLPANVTSISFPDCKKFSGLGLPVRIMARGKDYQLPWGQTVQTI